MSKETGIENDLRLMASREFNGRLFRNNVGVLKDETGRPVRYGLCVGSSDQIGWVPVTITPEMVGQTVAVFTAIEVKRDKKSYESWLKSSTKTAVAQRNFIAAVNASGGFGFCTYDAADAKVRLFRAIHPLTD